MLTVEFPLVLLNEGTTWNDNFDLSGLVAFWNLNPVKRYSSDPVAIASSFWDPEMIVFGAMLFQLVDKAVNTIDAE
jgi:hypothetical protein